MSGRHAGRVALVTGAGRGVGRGIALRLAQQGAVIAVNYRRDAEAAAATVADIAAVGGTARAYQASVDVEDDCRRMVDAVVDELGGIDILVNNGGIASRGLSVVDTDAEEVLHLFRTHAWGPFVLCGLVVPHMRTRPRGDIVMISSVTTTAPPPGGAPYTMAKAAMEALAQTLAAEERGHGIRVNVVAPGLVATDMGDRLARAITAGEASSADDLAAEASFGRVCQPADVAAAVAYLVSDDGSYVTGARLVIDGGATSVFRGDA